MPNMMKISIIIATYNASKTLKRCLDSIISQKNSEVELIIIDGDSTDETLSVINSYSSDIDYVLSEKDNGLYDAWNKGVKAAKGDWIMFLGADDRLLSNALEKYIELISSVEINSFDYISAKVNYLDENDHFLKVIGKGWKWNEFRDKMTVAHVASLHNRSLFKQVGLFNTSYKICADYELLMRKKDKLSAFFLDEIIANMEFGGVSFSKAAIYETCKICNTYNSNSWLKSKYLVCRKLSEFYFFLFRLHIRRILQHK